MSGKRSAARVDWRASELLSELMSARGWGPMQLETESRETGHPSRQASKSVLYRVLNEGHVPSAPIQFEICAAFGLVPPHLWGRLPIPEAIRYGQPVAA